MQNDKSNLFTLAKYINQEFLIEELLRVKEVAGDIFLSKFNKNKRILKIKIIITKVFYSIIFGILPVIPLMTFFEMKRELLAEGLPISVLIYGGSILFIFFFILQFLNIFFMGMTEVSVLMSNNLFLWLETLPISSKKLSRLKLISIFRNFDIPIIVIIFAFPIVMFIGTLNVLLFLICLGISILNIMFSFSVLIIFGDRMNRILDINMINSRKTMIIRLINIFGYVIVFFASLIFVQSAISSIPSFFRFHMVQRHPEILNLILCTIPYPFSSSYLISFITITNQIHFHYWIGMFCGLGLFIIFTRLVFRIALKDLDRITSSKGENLKKYRKPKIIEKKIRIKIRRPVLAHFIKDLSITSRNIKVFLSAITPILISFVFTYTFNFTVLQGQTPLDKGFFYNWVVILSMQPVICGMLIYNLINLEGSRESILIALPINPNKRAKAKLLYFTIIQTISVISPYLIYINDPRFMELLINVSFSLVFAWIFLFSMFEMYVYLFGRKKHRFVLDPIRPENKMIKWAFLYISEYIFYIIMVSTGIILNFIGLPFFIFNISLFLVASYCLLLLIFKMIFPPALEPEIRRKIALTLPIYRYKITPRINFITRHPWLSIGFMLLFDFFFVSLGNHFLAFFRSILNFGVYSTQIPYYFLFLFCVSPILILIFLKLNFIPKYGYTESHHSLPKYRYTESHRSLKFLKILKTGILGTISVILIHIIFSLTQLIPPFSEITIFLYIVFDAGFITFLLFATWHEIVFRAIIFPILRTKFKNSVCIYLNALIFFSYHFIYCLGFSFIYGDFNILFIILRYLIYMMVINTFLLYLFTKYYNIYPALIVHFLTNLIGLFPMFYFGIFIFFPSIFI